MQVPNRNLMIPIEHVDYYRILRSLLALQEGARGQEIWRLPHAVKEITGYIRKITKIRIIPPYASRGHA